MFERRDEADEGGGNGPPFCLLARLKAHARIVWGLDWSPDSRLLATASRDGSVKVWAAPPPGQAPASEPLATVQLGGSVRAVSFAPVCRPGARYHVGVGLEDGSLQLLTLSAREGGSLHAPDAQQQQHGGGGCSSSAPALEVEAEPSATWRSTPFTQHAAAVRRLCWRRLPDSGGAHPLQLASCSDDHSLRVFSVTL